MKTLAFVLQTQKSLATQSLRSSLMKSQPLMVVLLILVSSHVVKAEEFKPVTALKELEWLIGGYRVEGAMLMPGDPRGEPGTKIEAKVSWQEFGDHFVTSTFHTTVGGKTQLDEQMTVGLNSESKRLEAWAFTSNGIRGRGKIFSNGKILRFVFEGQDRNGEARNATVEINRKGDTRRYMARYTKLTWGGKDIPPPPATTAVPIKK
jgi:hypothetical protein